MMSCILFIIFPVYNMVFFFFFFNYTATTEIYTLSLHDALPISDQPAVHPAPHGHGLERRHRAEAAQIDVDVACRRRRREYRGRAAPAGRPLLDVARLEQKNARPARREREHGKPYPGEPPWTAGYRRLLGERISHFHLLLGAHLPRMLDLHLELGILRAPPERLDGPGRVGNQLRRISGPSRYHVRGNSTPG